jgi:hypothetical protein
MKHVLLKLVACFRPSQGRAIFAVCLAGIISALCALPCYSQSPTITSISKTTTQQFQTITIKGSGFGTQSPYTGDSDYISLLDVSKKPRREAGYLPDNDTVTLIVQHWEDSKIILGGFSGDWGQRNWTLAKGNKEIVRVWNAQSGDGPATKDVKIQGVETTTAISSSLNRPTYGQPVTFTAVVTSSAGPPPDGETVSFMQGEALLGTGTLRDGSASFTTSTLADRAGEINAVYGGDADFGASSSEAVKQVVD